MNKVRMCMDANDAAATSTETLLPVVQFNPECGAQLCYWHAFKNVFK